MKKDGVAFSDIPHKGSFIYTSNGAIGTSTSVVVSKRESMAWVNFASTSLFAEFGSHICSSCGVFCDTGTHSTSGRTWASWHICGWS